MTVIAIRKTLKTFVWISSKNKALSQLFYVLSKAFRWTVSAFPYTVMDFQCTVMARHASTVTPSMHCPLACPHALSRPPLYCHGLPIQLAWLSHAFVSPSPSCITKPSQSRNTYSSCTSLWISASLLPWHNLCNETFHVEFFFSANNFPSPHSPWRKQDLLPQKHWNNAHPGNPCPSPLPTTTFQSGLGPGQGDSSSAKEN